MGSKLTTAYYDLDLDATGWGTLRAEARISNVPSASPLLPIDGEPAGSQKDRRRCGSPDLLRAIHRGWHLRSSGRRN